MRIMILSLASVLAGAPLAAQTAVQQEVRMNQRQVQGAEAEGSEPLARVGGRIQNRVQNRLRNRIDRYYSPHANAASPFVIAGAQARTVPQRR